MRFGAGGGTDARGGALDSRAGGGAERGACTAGASCVTSSCCSAPQSVSISSVTGGSDGGGVRGGSLAAGLGGTDDACPSALPRSRSSLVTIASLVSYTANEVKGRGASSPENRMAVWARRKLHERRLAPSARLSVPRPCNFSRSCERTAARDARTAQVGGGAKISTFGSVNSSTAKRTPSRPIPESFMPP